MNLKVPGAILSLGCVFLSTGAKTIWGFLQPPFRELGLILRSKYSIPQQVIVWLYKVC